MNDSRLNRRQVVAALAGAAIVGVRACGVAAQRPTPDPDGTLTTPIGGNVIAWNAPWVREGEGDPVAQLALTDADTNEVVGSHAYDALTLVHPNRAIAEITCVPLPTFGVRWSLPSRWEMSTGEVILDQGGTPGGRYIFDFFAFEGVEYGRWTIILSPAPTATVDTRCLVAPVAEFGATLQALLAHITLDDAPVFNRLNPAVLQRMLDPLVGTALASAIEETEQDKMIRHLSNHSRPRRRNERS